MHEKGASCSGCGASYGLERPMFRCPGCGGSLEIEFDYPKLRKAAPRFRERPFGHARYAELYPVRELVSLGEGGTPLIRSRNLERELGLGFGLWFKLESQNPTGSFKDRGSSVEVAKALESRPGKGRVRAVVASTGNMGASLAAYSAVAGVSCTVLVPSDARAVKLMQIAAYGSRVVRIPGDYTQAARKAEEASGRGAWLFGDYLFRREGTKSVGLEIADMMEPDDVVCPVGNGTLISAVWKAFNEWKALGLSRSLPRMSGMQASGCSPVARAFRTGTPLAPMRGRTIAVAIECGAPLDGSRALSAVRSSGGFAADVTDREILRARQLLARREGIFAEPGGATAMAGIMRNRERFARGSRVVCIVTGHGLKEPRTPVPCRAA
jgi:threonine synthase